MNPRVVAATDGSAINNPRGPGGWAWFVSEGCWGAGGFAQASNQVAELFAVLALLRAAPRGQALLVRTDSKFVINSLTQWLPDWKARGWRKADGQPPANLSLIRELDRALAGRDVRFEWVRGHNGDRMNEVADRLCTAASAAVRDQRPVVSGPGWTAAAGAGLHLPQRVGDVASPRAASTVPRTASGGAPVGRRSGLPVVRRSASARTSARSGHGGAAAVFDEDGPIPTVTRAPDANASVKWCPSCDGPIDPVTYECHCSR